MERREAIRIAIEAEIRSQNLYKALAKSFGNPQSEQVFTRLIIFEEYHEAEMRDIFATEYPGEKLELIGELHTELKGIDLRNPNQVLEFAISREELAENIYRKLAEQTAEADTREILLQFAKEEAQHKEVLVAELERLQGILEWYDPAELTGLMEE
ncbi:MAG: ferritin family protein [Candidatus Cloacimonetes bacterium]|nr:ferritin family protein [Candidatus Cloacimonadota bacterium]